MKPSAPVSRWLATALALALSVMLAACGKDGGEAAGVWVFDGICLEPGQPMLLKGGDDGKPPEVTVNGQPAKVFKTSNGDYGAQMPVDFEGGAVDVVNGNSIAHVNVEICPPVDDGSGGGPEETETEAPEETETAEPPVDGGAEAGETLTIEGMMTATESDVPGFKFDKSQSYLIAPEDLFADKTQQRAVGDAVGEAHVGVYSVPGLSYAGLTLIEFPDPEAASDAMGTIANAFESSQPVKPNRASANAGGDPLKGYWVASLPGTRDLALFGSHENIGIWVRLVGKDAQASPQDAAKLVEGVFDQVM